MDVLRDVAIALNATYPAVERTETTPSMKKRKKSQKKTSSPRKRVRAQSGKRMKTLREEATRKKETFVVGEKGFQSTVDFLVRRDDSVKKAWQAYNYGEFQMGDTWLLHFIKRVKQSFKTEFQSSLIRDATVVRADMKRLANGGMLNQPAPTRPAPQRKVVKVPRQDVVRPKVYSSRKEIIRRNKRELKNKMLAGTTKTYNLKGAYNTEAARLRRIEMYRQKRRSLSWGKGGKRSSAKVLRCANKPRNKNGRFAKNTVVP